MRWLLVALFAGLSQVGLSFAETQDIELEQAPELLLVQIRLNGRLLPNFEDVLADQQGQLWLPLEAIVRGGEGTFVPEGPADFLITLGTALPEWRIDLDRGTFALDGREQPLPEGATVLEFDQLLVQADWLQEIYGLEAELADDRLQVLVTSQRPLPTDLRRLRERRWQRFGREEFRTEFTYVPLEAPYVAWGNPRGRVTAGTSVSSTDTSPPLRLSAAFDVEAAYFSNSVFLNVSDSGGLQSLRWTGGRVSPEGRAFGLPNVYRLEFGDVSSLRLPLQGGGGGGRGITFSTAPLDRPQLFDITVVEGDALPGWDVELYRGGELIDFQTIGDDGRYRFDDVPLGFGRNVLRVVLYGPQGEVEERDVVQAVGGGQLRPGDWHVRGSVVNTGRSVFNVGGGDRLSGDTASVRVDYGWSRYFSTGVFVGVTAQPWRAYAGSQNLRPFGVDAEDTLRLVDTGISISPALPWIASEWVMAQQDTGASAFQGNISMPLFWTNLSLRYEQYSDDYLSNQRQRGGGLISNRLAVRTTVPLGPLGSLPLQYDRFDLADGTVRHEWLPRYRHRFFGLNLAHDLRLVQQGQRRQSQYRLLTSVRYGDWTGRLQYQATGARTPQFSSGRVQASADTVLDAQRSLGLSAGYTLGSEQFSVSGRLSQTLGPGQLSVSASVSQSGGWSAGLSFAIGLGSNGRRPISLLPQADTTGGSVMVQFFEDMDGDGLFDPDIDIPIEGAGLTVDGRPVETRSDADGWLVVGGLSRERPSRIGLDRDQMGDPFLSTARPRVKLQGRPGFVHQLSMPFQDSGFASGTVLRRGVPAPGIRVEAERLDGATREFTFSLSDGYFGFETLAPGMWRLRIEPDSVPEGWTSSEVEVEIESGSGVDGLEIVLEPPVQVETDDPTS